MLVPERKLRSGQAPRCTRPPGVDSVGVGSDWGLHWPRRETDCGLIVN